ncbi:MAG: GDSL-type esterase/lipase family protein [Phormidesmis sp.]
MSSVVNWFTKIPSWAALSLVMNGLLFGTLLAVGQEGASNASDPTLASASDRVLASRSEPLEQWRPGLDTGAGTAIANATITDKVFDLPMPEGDRKLTYSDHVKYLGDRAVAMAAKHPEHLTVLLGDSLSLWFPGELMPGQRVWINQSISGERTQGLLKRLDLIEKNDIESIFLMIGINDLIWDKTDKEIIDNYQKIVRRLKTEHPGTQIVVQSILPHGGENSTWESRDKLLALPSDRIVTMNEALKKIAKDNGAYYLDLYPIFVTGEGRLRPDLTTDGLHLNREGYLVWRSAIALYAQLELQ